MFLQLINHTRRRPGPATFKLFFAMIAYRTNHICIVRTNLREMAPY